MTHAQQREGEYRASIHRGMLIWRVRAILVMPTVREKKQLMSASEIDRTLVRLAHEILEKTNDLGQLAFIGIRRRGVPLAQRLAAKIKQRFETTKRSSSKAGSNTSGTKPSSRERRPCTDSPGSGSAGRIRGD